MQSLARAAIESPSAKIDLKEHVPRASWTLYTPGKWSALVQDQSYLLPASVTQSIDALMDLYMKEAIRCGIDVWGVALFGGITAAPTNRWLLPPGVMSLRISSDGVALLREVGDAAPLWRLPWLFLANWSRTTRRSEFRIAFDQERLSGPPLLLRSSQCAEVLSMLTSYHNALREVARFARLREAVKSRGVALEDESTDSASESDVRMPKLAFAAGSIVEVLQDDPTS